MHNTEVDPGEAAQAGMDEAGNHLGEYFRSVNIRRVRGTAHQLGAGLHARWEEARHV